MGTGAIPGCSQDRGRVMTSTAGKLHRQLLQYANCSPDAISNGSQAMIRFFVADAQHDIAVLSDALRNFTDGRDISYQDALRIAREALSPRATT